MSLHTRNSTDAVLLNTQTPYFDESMYRFLMSTGSREKAPGVLIGQWLTKVSKLHLFPPIPIRDILIISTWLFCVVWSVVFAIATIYWCFKLEIGFLSTVNTPTEIKVEPVLESKKDK